METLRVALLPLPNAPSQARRATRAACAGLTEQLQARIELVVSELVANAVEHAALEQRELIEFQVQVEHGCCRVVVDDPGLGFTADQRRPCPDTEATTGRGLFLVSALSRRWRVERLDQKTRVWAEIA